MKSTIKFLVLTMLLMLALASIAGCTHLEHTWAEATCTAPKTCTGCGITEGEALGHTEQIIPAKEATCYEKGLTEGKICSVCNEVLVEQKVVLSLGHDMVIDQPATATCTQPGLTAGAHCSRCDYKEEQTETPALGHSYMFPCDAHCQVCGELSNENAAHTIVAVAAKAATCTATGNVAYWYCSDCGAAWLDEALTQLTNQKNVVTPALDHSYMFPCDAHCQACGELTNPNAAHTIVAVAAKAATCTANGNVAYWYCSDCGAAWADEALTQVTNRMNVVIPAPGHSYMFPCDAHCMNCGELTNPNAAHTIVAVEAKAATCTANGNVAYWTCSDCGGAWLDEALTLVANRMSVIVPATDHTYEGFSCETDGVCSCGAIKPAAHTLNYVAAAVATTCLETSHDEYWECTACGAYFGDAEASYQLNPAFLFSPGEHTRPEGAADCAIVPCTVCGEDTYGEGDHDVFACKGGLCTKCNTEIEGYGCANYDTPACEDGFCYYCGDPVKGFGHENGAWAPCLDGECSYGCGLKYPATEDHVDADADDYCDNCWNHIKHDVDPCLGGECSICWTYIEPAHKIVAVDALAPTCYENGNIAYWYCEVCGQAWLDADCTLNTNLKAVVLPMAHGTITAVEAVAPTCYENGNIAYWYCADCGQAWLDADCTLNTNLKAVVLPMAHGEIVAVEAKDATCYENGNIAYWYCEACGQAWLDADCTLNTNLKAVVLPMAHGAITHVEAVAPTCTAMGNIECWYCEACGQAWLDEACTLNTNLKAVKLPATHTYTYPCDQICSVCYELTNPDATHTIVAVEAKAATCTANGNVAYWYCSDCGAAWTDEALTQVTNQRSVIIPALGHKDENGDYKCDKCSTKMLPAAGESLTIPQALAIAKLMGDTYTTQKYYITGIILSVANTQYGNLTIRDENGEELYVYGLYSADGKTGYSAMSYKPVQGDEITIYTTLGCYYGAPQAKNAWMDECVKHTEHTWVDATCTAPKTCSICAATEGTPIDHVYVDGVCACGKEEGVASLANAKLDFGSKSNRTTFTTSQQVWEQNGVKLINDKASSTSNVADYAGPARFYKSSKITIEGAGMKVIQFTCNSSSYATTLKSSITSNSNYTVTVSGSVVTVTFVEAVDSFVIASLSSGQVRMNSLVVNP